MVPYLPQRELRDGGQLVAVALVLKHKRTLRNRTRRGG